jgi:adenosylcobinamide-phosphate synthase
VRVRTGLPLAAGIAAGAALDALAGDPRRGHPVAAFGRAAAALEARDYADSRPRGAAHAAACVLAAAAPAALARRRLRRRPPLHAAAVAATVWAVTGARSLRLHAERIVVSLHRNDLAAARQALPGLCGRDPDGLGAGDIARAVIESVAENTCDAAVAPLLCGAVAGLPGLAAYRAINTLDAMVGYRSARYRRFGWASARLDDAANWVPARVTAALAVACAAVVPGCDAAAALRVLRRDGGRHPSPNAGRCEAAFAGALGVRLGGTNVYGGVAEARPQLGEGRAPEPDDIRRAVRLSRAVTVAAAGLAVLVALAAPLLRAGPRAVPGPRAGPRAVPGPRAGPRAVPGPRTGPRAVPGPRAGPRAVPGPRAGPRAVPGPRARPAAARR